MLNKWSVAVLVGVVAIFSHDEGAVMADDKPIRVGLVGLDTSHAPAFAKSLNAQPAKPGLEGARVVAAFPGGSPDMPVSINRVEGFTKLVSEQGVQIVDSIEELVKLVDVVIINSLDGRVHLDQAKTVIAAGKPLFIDKPLSASLSDGQKIFDLAKEHKVPCFSSSSLRYCTELIDWTNQKTIFGCEAYSPCSVGEHHPTLFWYGIHGVETLFAVMGPGCETVTSIRTPGQDVVVGVWNDGRVGTFRGTRQGKSGFGATVFGSEKIAGGPVKVNYDLLLVEIVKFFKTGTPPVAPETTLEILAFMEAADESHEQGGKPVKLKTTAAVSKQ
ncbi:MAG TPA: Gfo/Idh/MocA family oxidoreductase [Planctomicrobium sp.]|nr:Gfo/Idh/MocA family oxidoreductase [Planctomicrobium sp.]